MKKVLRVTGKGYVAGAVFVKGGGGWRCVRHAPILGELVAWMRGRSAEGINAEMARRGLRWEWV